MVTAETDFAGHRKVRLTAEARRLQIINEATRLIAASGFNAVSLADIAAACNIRKPSVLHYFPTMHHLLAAVLAARDERDFLGPGQATLPAPEPAAARAWCTAIFRDSSTRPEFARLHHILGAEALSPDHPAHGFFVQRSQLSRSTLSRVLAFKHDPATAAVELLAVWQGLEVEGLRDPNLDVNAVWETFCDRFFV